MVGAGALVVVDCENAGVASAARAAAKNAFLQTEFMDISSVESVRFLQLLCSMSCLGCTNNSAWKKLLQTGK
jgi:hypothetical protein